MKIQSVIFFGFLGVIGFFSYSEAKRSDDAELQIRSMFLPTLDCYLGRRTCNGEDYYAKQFIADKLTHNCSRCDASMRDKLHKQLNVFYHLFHEDFELLVDKYSVPSILECLLQNGPCSPPLKTVKTILPHYLKYNECPGCSDEFKKRMLKRFDHLRRYHPKKWRQIVQKYSRQ